MFNRLSSFRNDQSGAVAVTYALALTGLITIAGVGFDYARLMTVDSELQSAADEAALAAATQLDGRIGAIDRANKAVKDYFAKANSTSAVVNRTLLANDKLGSALTGVTFTFYKSFDSAADSFGAVVLTSSSTADADAKVVKVTIGGRKAFYALTPIVGAFTSGNLSADAVAGLQSSVCKVPPLMICNPNEPAGLNFPTASDRGKGVKLEAGGGGAWAPGNYGYLNFGNGAHDLAEGLGANGSVDNCVDQTTLTTKTGNNASVTKALNTRFDLYENGLTNYCTGTTCSPALNVGKDLVHLAWGTGNNQSNDPSYKGSNGNNSNGVGSQKAWDLPTNRYLGTSTPVPDNMGLPRDICHATSSAGSCTNGRYGDGIWDRTLYFQVVHPGTSASVAQTWAGRATLGDLSRYDVYKWEIATSGMLADRQAELRQKYNGQGNPVGQKNLPFYAFSTPKYATGLAESSNQKDRRVLTAAVVNCTANNVSGNTQIYDIANWIDIFLVEPSINRTYTNSDQIYGEIIGVATKPGGGTAFQYYGRQKAVLLQ
jgi:Flp pilus assembly protein TadG